MPESTDEAENEAPFISRHADGTKLREILFITGLVEHGRLFAVDYPGEQAGAVVHLSGGQGFVGGQLFEQFDVLIDEGAVFVLQFIHLAALVFEVEDHVVHFEPEARHLILDPIDLLAHVFVFLFEFLEAIQAFEVSSLLVPVDAVELAVLPFEIAESPGALAVGALHGGRSGRVPHDRTAWPDGVARRHFIFPSARKTVHVPSSVYRAKTYDTGSIYTTNAVFSAKAIMSGSSKLDKGTGEPTQFLFS